MLTHALEHLWRWRDSNRRAFPVVDAQSCPSIVTTLRYGRSMRCRRCRECEKVFRPSSGHLACPACRSRDLCTCGQPKQVKSATCSACRSESWDANSNWRGGRSRHKAGYVVVRVPDHPRAGRHPYVFEHVLVAEQMLGRYLVKGETVHHRNGVRDDNRPENLELWTRPQPSGIRVSDALAWAHEIIERYEGVSAPPTMLTRAPEHPWRWRDSNPRPPESQ